MGLEKVTNEINTLTKEICSLKQKEVDIIMSNKLINM